MKTYIKTIEIYHNNRTIKFKEFTGAYPRIGDVHHEYDNLVKTIKVKRIYPSTTHYACDRFYEITLKDYEDNETWIEYIAVQ